MPTGAFHDGPSITSNDKSQDNDKQYDRTNDPTPVHVPVVSSSRFFRNLGSALITEPCDWGKAIAASIAKAFNWGWWLDRF